MLSGIKRLGRFMMGHSQLPEQMGDGKRRTAQRAETEVQVFSDESNDSNLRRHPSDMCV